VGKRTRSLESPLDRRAAVRIVFGAVWLAVASSCSADSGPTAVTPGSDSDPASPGPAPAGERVLFVGNSLTYGNDLPLLVEATALTIYSGLTGGSPIGLPVRLRLRNGKDVEIEARYGPALQAAAEEAVARQ
jgi:hypothetical protein